MASLSVSRFALTILLYFLLSSPTFAAALNITSLLSLYPDLSAFAALLANTSVAADLTDRSSLTLLVVPNRYLSSPPAAARRAAPSNFADVLRYNVLLQYLSPSDLAQIPATGKLITTLYQTTGRATDNFGLVNITRNPLTGAVSVSSPASNATILSNVTAVPYNVSIFAVDSLLVPYGLDLLASESRPPLGLNITKALIDGHNFNVAASMLAASGVVQEFEADEGGAGLTLFVPTDDAFADLPTTERLQSLPADKKAIVLKFHVLHSYYPLGSLQSIVNPVQPTVATEDTGAGTFTLNISRFNGSVVISSGIVQASVTQTVFDEKPMAIFGVSRVLLPREIFGKNAIDIGGGGGAPPPGILLSPQTSPGMFSPPSRLSSPPGFREEIRSGATTTNDLHKSCIIVTVCCCIGLYLLV
ncbi:fasciclin-like arabinogalactan protein 4 [Malania oleifera]|uniref:fasciclin-like arabinogalactan protein 4 n=1 Tax=Malania oleifera TaxID=397392 RepID=UPI0025AE4DE6|nr:fasciclin-like arabinogalactan protein 4 [Malania oleifera]